jgi:hypothetical protein
MTMLKEDMLRRVEVRVQGEEELNAGERVSGSIGAPGEDVVEEKRVNYLGPANAEIGVPGQS